MIIMIDTDRLLNPEAAILSLEQGRNQKIGDELNHRSGESRNRQNSYRLNGQDVPPIVVHDLLPTCFSVVNSLFRSCKSVVRMAFYYCSGDVHTLSKSYSHTVNLDPLGLGLQNIRRLHVIFTKICFLRTSFTPFLTE